MSSQSIQGVSQALSQFFQNVGAAGAAQSTQATSSTDSTTSTGSSQPGVVALNIPTHHHHRGGNKLFQQIQQAVTTALQNARTSGSSTDPNQTIQDAISQVLKGVDSASDGSSSTSNADPLSATASTSSGTSSTDSTASFFQLLKSNGVNPKQFQQDFLAAIQQAQNGQVNPASVFQSLPPGSVLDAIG